MLEMNVIQKVKHVKGEIISHIFKRKGKRKKKVSTDQ